MKFLTEFRRSELAAGLLTKIRSASRKPVRLMEFCGGHTVTIFRYGLRRVLPKTITMLSGPGCPVCVTATADLDKAIALAKIPDLIIATFGDMVRVPGSSADLQTARADGADLRIVYSTLDALALAEQNPRKKVVFLGIGFETTAPAAAASILQAEEQGLDNYYLLSLHKLCPPVIRALFASGKVDLDGLICPGHVSTVIGSQAWEFIARDYGIPCVVSGFEPLDILHCVDMLVSQVEKGESRVEIAYRRGVQYAGNSAAQRLMEKVFEPCSANWRGMGTIPDSGLRLAADYQRFDAELAFAIEPGPTREPEGCICGDILRGEKSPLDCDLFRTVCTPEDPVGPCMVSAEGSCSTYYQYGGEID